MGELIVDPNANNSQRVMHPSMDMSAPVPYTTNPYAQPAPMSVEEAPVLKSEPPMESNYSKSSSPDRSECKRTLGFVSIIVGVIVGLIFLILAIIAYQDVQNFSGAYQDAIDTWKTVPINDIQFVTAVPPAIGSCPAGYDPVVFRWPGIFPACTCTGAAARNSSDTSACDSTKGQPTSSCTTRSSHPGLSIDIFPGNTMCARRQGVTAENRPAVQRQSNGRLSCPSGFQVCGNSTSLATSYCGPAANACPITDMAVTTSLVNLGNISQPITVIPIGTYDGFQRYFYFTRGGAIPDSVIPFSQRGPLAGAVFRPTGLPITDLSIIGGIYECYLAGCSWGERRSSEFSSAASSMKSAESSRGYTVRGVCSGCTDPSGIPGGSISPDGIDLRYSSAASRYERNVFQPYVCSGSTQNTCFPSYYNTGSTSASSSALLQILARSEIPWKAACPRNRGDAISRADDVRYVQGLQIMLLIISVITFIIFSLLTPVLEYKYKHLEEDKSYRRKRLCGKIFFRLLALACTIATMAIVISTLNFWEDVKTGKAGVTAAFSVSDANNGTITATADSAALDASFINAPCADPLTSEIFRKLSDIFLGLSNKDIGSFVVVTGDGALAAVKELIN